MFGLFGRPGLFRVGSDSDRAHYGLGRVWARLKNLKPGPAHCAWCDLFSNGQSRRLEPCRVLYTVPTLANLLPPRIRERQSRRSDTRVRILLSSLNYSLTRQAFPDPRTLLSQSLHYSEVFMLVGLIQDKLPLKPRNFDLCFPSSLCQCSSIPQYFITFLSVSYSSTHASC